MGPVTVTLAVLCLLARRLVHSLNLQQLHNACMLCDTCFYASVHYICFRLHMATVAQVISQQKTRSKHVELQCIILAYLFLIDGLIPCAIYIVGKRMSADMKNLSNAMHKPGSQQSVVQLEASVAVAEGSLTVCRLTMRQTASKRSYFRMKMKKRMRSQTVPLTLS